MVLIQWFKGTDFIGLKFLPRMDGWKFNTKHSEYFQKKIAEYFILHITFNHHIEPPSSIWTTIIKASLNKSTARRFDVIWWTVQIPLSSAVCHISYILEGTETKGIFNMNLFEWKVIFLWLSTQSRISCAYFPRQFAFRLSASIPLCNVSISGPREDIENTAHKRRVWNRNMHLSPWLGHTDVKSI